MRGLAQIYDWRQDGAICSETLYHIMLSYHLRKAGEANFSFFTSLSTGEAHVFGVKFIGLYGTVGFLAIRDFSF